MKYNLFMYLKKSHLFIVSLLIPLTIFAIYYLSIIRPSSAKNSISTISRPNIVLITLDTTRPDRLGAYGYTKAKTPNIDNLAHSGVLFKRAYSPVPLTLPAHTSILTGTYPPYHGVRNNGKYVLSSKATTLAEILKTFGYTTAAFISSYILDSRFGLDQGFDYYGDQLDNSSKLKNLESERKAESTFTEFAHWFKKYQGNNFFVWIHFFDPHYPYDPPEPYKSDPELSDPYDGEIAYMDSYIGEVVRLLQAKGYADSTIMVLAGDHGEAFGEHQEYGHTIYCYEENIRVPLIFYGPRFVPAGKEIAESANLVDIFPTILDLLRIEAPHKVQGKSLVPLIKSRKEKTRIFYFESLYSQDILGCSPLQGIIRNNLKLIRVPKLELYDLASDPQEKNNLAEVSLSKTREMLKIIDRFEKEISTGGWQLAERKVESTVSQKLRSLGYLVGSGEQGNLNKTRTYDPKDRIAFWNKSLLANQLLKQGKLSEAEKCLRELLQEDPYFTPAIEELAEVYFLQKNKDALINFFENTLKKIPASSSLILIYSQYLVRLGLPQKALLLLDAIKGSTTPDEEEQFFFTMASAFGQLQQFDKAQECFMKVLEIEPENWEALRLIGFGLLQQARYLEAISYLKKAIDRTSSAPLFFDYALALAGAGQFELAIDWMEKARFQSDADENLKLTAKKLIVEWRSSLERH